VPSNLIDDDDDEEYYFDAKMERLNLAQVQGRWHLPAAAGARRRSFILFIEFFRFILFIGEFVSAVSNKVNVTALDAKGSQVPSNLIDDDEEYYFDAKMERLNLAQVQGRWRLPAAAGARRRAPAVRAGVHGRQWLLRQGHAGAQETRTTS
jgi:hypothetical protein